jgi:PAS domain S-box-containing protein
MPLRSMPPTRAKALAVALTLVILALDYVTPNVINAAIFYGCVVVVLAWTQSNLWLWGGTAVVTVLAVLGLTAGSEPVGLPGIDWTDWANRSITASMLFVTAGFVHIGMRLSRQLAASEQLLAEVTARERAEKALRERNALIRRLVESNIIGIFFWDSGGRISEANDAFLQTVDYSQPDLLSQGHQWTDFTAPEFRAAELRAIDELKRNGNFAPFENEYIRQDGSRIPVLIGGTLLGDSHQQGVAFVLDLTQRKQAQAAREARRVAETANRAKNEFLANMSHELRTPLNGILGYAQILRRDPMLGERQLEAIGVIQQSGEQLLTLINDILDFAKIEAGKLELTRTDIVLTEFLRMIAEIINVKAVQKGLSFIRDIAPDLPKGIRADEGRLRQILLNLLTNAVKFTDQGRVILRVRFSPPARLRFEVQDTGIGVGTEHLETIFQPFEQVSDPQRRLGGTGLGLAISQQFVRLMGSAIYVTSELGAGSTFWFELEVPVMETVAVAPPARLVTGYEGPRKKVLVVDDVAANRAMAVDMLKQLDFNVSEAVNGRDGLERAQVIRPDWILLDIVMPEMNGLEVARRLRQLPGLEDVPIIAMSASASRGDEQQSLAAGADAFVPKPIDLHKLLTQIALLLKLKWTYALPTAQSDAQGDALAPLYAPPPQEMETLHRLALVGDMRAIVRQATYLSDLDERYRPFAARLCQLAKGYQSQATLSLIKRYLEGNQAP